MLNIENDNSGLIFESQSDNPKAPAYSGAIKVGGVQYKIALWEKEFKNGNGFTVSLQEDSESSDESPAPRGNTSGRNLSARRKPSRGR